MAKRLTRTKQKIAQAHIPYRVPADAELPGRLPAVLATVYLIFNEGYAASGGDLAVRTDLADEAIRLARLLCELMPDEASVVGLLALLLLQDSRRAARVDEAGELVLLADQDRSLWDGEKIVEGVRLVGKALQRSPDRPDSYAVQAAIAACHALAPSYGDTDWSAIVSWYDVLLTVTDTPVVRLNRAAAVAERDGAQAGLAEMDGIEGLQDYPYWHASRADLLDRLGRRSEAADGRSTGRWRCGSMSLTPSICVADAEPRAEWRGAAPPRPPRIPPRPCADRGCGRSASTCSRTPARGGRPDVAGEASRTRGDGPSRAG